MEHVHLHPNIRGCRYSIVVYINYVPMHERVYKTYSCASCLALSDPTPHRAREGVRDMAIE